MTEKTNLMNLQIDAACISHKGRVRSNNEDNLYFDRQILPEIHTGTEKLLSACFKVSNEFYSCMAVFDGMGGESYGEQASFLAARSLQNNLKNYHGQDLKQFLIQCCLEMNEEICRATVQNQCKRMGTTAAIVMFADERMYCCNVGDSRIFLMTGGVIHQISVDHTNELTMKKLGVKGKKPQLTQHLGIPRNVMQIAPAVSEFEVHYGDQFLICSDGLTDMLSLEQISAIMQRNDVKNTCCSLIAEANVAGGKDNITVITGKIGLGTGNTAILSNAKMMAVMDRETDRKQSENPDKKFAGKINFPAFPVGILLIGIVFGFLVGVTVRGLISRNIQTETEQTIPYESLKELSEESEESFMNEVTDEAGIGLSETLEEIYPQRRHNGF